MTRRVEITDIPDDTTSDRRWWTRRIIVTREEVAQPTESDAAKSISNRRGVPLTTERESDDDGR